MKSRDLNQSAALLTGANLVCAAIGAAQGLLVIRLLGPELYGSAAVVLALTAVATNLIDVRLIDLVSNLYYDERAARPESAVAYRTSALRLGLHLYALSAGLIAAASLLLMLGLARRFTSVPLANSWLVVAALGQGVTYFGSFFIFVQRFIAPPRRMAQLQFVSAIVNAAAMIAVVASARSVGGYLAASLLSALGIAIVNAFFTVAQLRSQGVHLFGRRPAEAPAIDRSIVFKFITAGNVLGYVKLLHRSADVLLVAAFCSDRDTGVYKLARTIADALLTISEAFGRVYQPRFLALLQSRERNEYDALARSITVVAGVLTMVAIAGGIVVLPYVAPLLHVTDVRALVTSVAIMTVSFFFVAGMQSWIWPAFVFSGRLARCTLWGVVGVLAGQYAIGPALVFATGTASVVWFSIGYLSFDLLSILPLWQELRREDAVLAWPVKEQPATP